MRVSKPDLVVNGLGSRIRCKQQDPDPRIPKRNWLNIFSPVNFWSVMAFFITEYRSGSGLSGTRIQQPDLLNKIKVESDKKFGSESSQPNPKSGIMLGRWRRLEGKDPETLELIQKESEILAAIADSQPIKIKTPQ